MPDSHKEPSANNTATTPVPERAPPDQQLGPEGEITELLHAWNRGDEGAFDRLAPLIYVELRHQARRHMARERPGHTLQTTALVHEAYLRMARLPRLRWKNRVQLFAISAQLMRRVLVDYARARNNQKRGGANPRVALDEAAGAVGQKDVDLVALDDALNALSEVDPRKCKVVEMKFFGGLEAGEIAEVLHVSVETVERDWKLAKLWLLRELRGKQAK